MSTEIIVLLFILAATIFLFATEKLPLDLVALLGSEMMVEATRYFKLLNS